MRLCYSPTRITPATPRPTHNPPSKNLLFALSLSLVKHSYDNHNHNHNTATIRPSEHRALRMRNSFVRSLSCCWFLLSEFSRALSTTISKDKSVLRDNKSFSTTRFGMPAADRTFRRYDHRTKPNKSVVLDCQCGRVRVTVAHADIRVDPPPPPKHKKRDSTYHAAVDCHCPSCRKYHVADRATYLLVPTDKVEFQEFHVPGGGDESTTTTGMVRPTPSPTPQNIETVASPSLYTFRDSCQHLGPVVRYQCAHCRTKIATQPRQGDQDGQDDQERRHGSDRFLLNLASVRDDSLPKKWTKQWRAFRFPWQYANQCVWTRACADSEDQDSDGGSDSDSSSDSDGSKSSSSSSSGDDSDDEDEDGDDEDIEQDEKEPRKGGGSPQHVTGSCACGTYRYQINYPSITSATTELQHCYCQLCRRLSGGPFQTWMPASRKYFKWLPRKGSDSDTAPPHEPPMYRYTGHGRRHVCDNCGGVLTIVYDADGDYVVWPAAGSIDDSCLPPTKEEMSKFLYGVCHICCRYRQSWYALPNDGNSRISEAS